MGWVEAGREDPHLHLQMGTCDRLALGRPEVGQYHLMPFLLPTMFCDCECESIVALSRDLVPPGGHAAGWMRTARVLSDTRSNSLPGTSAENAARRVRSWVRRCAQNELKSHPKSLDGGAHPILSNTNAHMMATFDPRARVACKVPRLAADVQRRTVKSPTRWT